MSITMTYVYVPKRCMAEKLAIFFFQVNGMELNGMTTLEVNMTERTRESATLSASM